MLTILRAVGLDEGTQKSFEEEAPCILEILGPTWEQLARSASLQTGAKTEATAEDHGNLHLLVSSGSGLKAGVILRGSLGREGAECLQHPDSA